jgi:DNA repair exonuclease SbcCD ATPase subunit
VLYRIERTIERSKKSISTNAEIYKNNMLVEHGQTAVSSYVQSLISVDYDLFTRAIYSEQNNLDHFLNLDPKRRKEEIDTLLGLDKFELARANTVSVVNQVRSKKEGVSGQFNHSEVQEIQKKEGECLSLIAATTSKLAELNSQVSALSDAIAATSKLFENMKKEKDVFEKLDRELLRLNTQVDSLKKELEGKNFDHSQVTILEQKFASSNSAKEKLLGEIKLLEQKQTSLSKEIGSIEGRIKTIVQAEATISTLRDDLKKQLGESSLDQLNQELKEQDQQLLSASSEKSSLEREIKEINDLIPRLKEGDSKCPLCLSDLASHSISHIRAEKARLLSEKNSRLVELSSLISALKTKITSLTSRSKSASLISEKLKMLKPESADELSAARTTLELGLTNILTEKKQFQSKVDAINTDLDSTKYQLKELREGLAKKSNLDSISKNLFDTKERLSTIKFDGAEFDNLRTQVESKRLEIERQLASKKTLEIELRNSNDLLKVVRERIAKIKSVEAEIIFLSKLEEELAIYKNALLETQTSLRLNLIDAINNAMNEIWPIFYPYKNYHALRLGANEKDYVFEVFDGQEWKSLETMASGGERACAALALRVAFAMVLTPNLSWLILDEPTHNLDSGAVQLLSSALQYKVPEVVKQTFIITHDEGFMGSEFASSYRLDRDKTNNGETKIDQA